MTGAAAAPGAQGSAQAASRRSISLTLLRGFKLHIDGRAVQVPLGSQRVVAFLVLNRGWLARIYVAGNLWMDASEERAAAALRTALWRLGRPAGGLVCCHGPALSIDPGVRVDIDVATLDARKLLDESAAPVPETALAHLRDDGELLPDWYDDWVIIERERFRQLRLHALEALCRRLSADGRHAQATEAGLAAIASEPLRESAHRALISAHLREGNACEALRQYRFCSALLRNELGLDGDPRVRRTSP